MLDAYYIAWLRHKGIIRLDPFVPACLGPNSYDVHLSPWIAEVTPRGFQWHRIGPEGLELKPGVVYLGSTVEVVGAYSDAVPRMGPCTSGMSVGLRVSATLDGKAGTR